MYFKESWWEVVVCRGSKQEQATGSCGHTHTHTKYLIYWKCGNFFRKYWRLNGFGYVVGFRLVI